MSDVVTITRWESAKAALDRLGIAYHIGAHWITLRNARGEEIESCNSLDGIFDVLASATFALRVKPTTDSAKQEG